MVMYLLLWLQGGVCRWSCICCCDCKEECVDGHVFVVFGLNVVDSSYLLLWLQNVVGGLWMVVYLFLWLFEWFWTVNLYAFVVVLGCIIVDSLSVAVRSWRIMVYSIFFYSTWLDDSGWQYISCCIWFDDSDCYCICLKIIDGSVFASDIYRLSTNPNNPVVILRSRWSLH